MGLEGTARNMWSGRIAVVAVAMICALFLAAPASIAFAKGTVALSAKLSGDARKTRFVATLSKNGDFSVFALADPYRVIVDLPNAEFRMPAGVGTKGRGLVSAFRYGLFAPGKARIVLDVTGPVRVAKARIERMSSGAPTRLIVELVPTSRAKFAASQAKRAKQRKAAKSPLRGALVPQRKSARDDKTVIVIDPGHGGIDSGAVSRKGINEKSIVLAFCKALRNELAKRKGYHVIMTRDTDVFIPLDDRVDFARSHGGKLFISVHTDSLPKRFANSVRGATVYTLSENGSDAVARALAAKENRSDIIAGVELEEKEDVLAGILIDLAQRETHIRSHSMAKTFLGQLRRSTKLNKQPHRSAAFQVLKAPDIPSVLLELGYLSNKNDERLLRSKKWRAKVAKSVATAVEKYLSKRIAGFPF